MALLVVEDDVDFRETLVALLERQGCNVTAVDSCGSAREALARREFDAVLADRSLPDGDGSLLLAKPGGGATDLIVITGTATVASAIDALKGGALDYLTKPLEVDRLKHSLAHLRRANALKRQLLELRTELLARLESSPIVGRSPPMQSVLLQIARIAPTNASVLISGESGTGKEVVAQAIHQLSTRKEAPLITVNCGAIPETLIESELFGHERGSFTGADKLRRGVFERADGGTLFLDEITEMPPRAQVRLLRVLENGRVQRVGGSEEFPVDVRVIAATNRVPADAVRDRLLREDLYFRLATFPIELPPLRLRHGDVKLLAVHFLDLLNRAHDTRKAWAGDALEQLEQRPWRGNVRELKNATYRAWILADEVLLQEDAAIASAFEAAPAAGKTFEVAVGSSIAAVERQLIVGTLELTHGDKPAAARLLGISLKTLYNRLSIYRASAQ